MQTKKARVDEVLLEDESEEKADPLVGEDGEAVEALEEEEEMSDTDEIDPFGDRFEQ